MIELVDKLDGFVDIAGSKGDLTELAAQAQPSLGLAPVLVQRFLSQTRELVTKNGLSILLVEQNVPAALRVSDRAYFMRSGRIILEESAEVALARGSWWDLF